MNKLIPFLFLLFLISCSTGSETEVHQKKRENVRNVQDLIKAIDMEETPVTDFAKPILLGDYLIISDYKSFDKLIHIYDKNSFTYLASTADRGQGSHEIANLGWIVADERTRTFDVIDHGKQRIFGFDLDSVLINPNYLPKVRYIMDENFYPDYYTYINDTVVVGTFTKPIGDSDYRPVVSRWNTKTGEIDLMEYTGHPEIRRKRADMAVSPENDIYVECYWHHDLMTIGDLNGTFKRNIYGAKWNTKHSNADLYYSYSVITQDRILASYSGGTNFHKKKNGAVGANYPTKFLVFDLEGRYIQTLDIGYDIHSICYDKDNHRLILVLDDEKLVSYLDLEGILE